MPVPIIAAVRPFDSLLHAEYLANEVPNIRVPEALLARMRRAEGPDAAVDEGIAIARELARELRTRAQGLQIGGPMASVLAVLDGVVSARPWRDPAARVEPQFAP